MVPKQLNNEFLNKLRAEDEACIRELITLCKLYLKKEISGADMIVKGNEICTVYSDIYDNIDPNLIAFKALWSDMTDIEDEIRDRKSVPEDLAEFVESQSGFIKKVCKEIISQYIPLLKNLNAGRLS